MWAMSLPLCACLETHMEFFNVMFIFVTPIFSSSLHSLSAHSRPALAHDPHSLSQAAGVRGASGVPVCPPLPPADAAGGAERFEQESQQPRRCATRPRGAGGGRGF